MNRKLLYILQKKEENLSLYKPLNILLQNNHSTNNKDTEPGRYCVIASF